MDSHRDEFPSKLAYPSKPEILSKSPLGFVYRWADVCPENHAAVGAVQHRRGFYTVVQ